MSSKTMPEISKSEISVKNTHVQNCHKLQINSTPLISEYSEAQWLEETDFHWKLSQLDSITCFVFNFFKPSIFSFRKREGEFWSVISGSFFHLGRWHSGFSLHGSTGPVSGKAGERSHLHRSYANQSHGDRLWGA